MFIKHLNKIKHDFLDIYQVSQFLYKNKEIIFVCVVYDACFIQVSD